MLKQRKFMVSGFAGIREGGGVSFITYMIKPAKIRFNFVLPFFPKEPSAYQESSTPLEYTQTESPGSMITTFHAIEAVLPSKLLTLEFHGSTIPVDVDIERGYTVHLTLHQSQQRDTTLMMKVTNE